MFHRFRSLGDASVAIRRHAAASAAGVHCRAARVRLLLVAALALPAFAQAPPELPHAQAQGYTLIDSLEALQAMANKPSGNYALGVSIDASATADWNGGAGFVPIGTQSQPFSGIFDGQGHTIRGLVIQRPGENNVGLFGHAQNATLRNVGLLESRIAGQENVGALVGHNEGVNGGVSSITHAYASAQVTGAAEVGGLVGHNQAYRGNAYITNAYASGPVTAAHSNVGGLVGHNEAYEGTASIVDAYATGPVKAQDYAGGLVGYNDSLNGVVSISRAYASGAVQATGEVSGGLVGLNTNGQIELSFYASSDAHGKPINRTASDAGQGATWQALQQRSTFAGWSMDPGEGGRATWHIDEGRGMPQLRGLAP